MFAVPATSAETTRSPTVRPEGIVSRVCGCEEEGRRPTLGVDTGLDELREISWPRRKIR